MALLNKNNVYGSGLKDISLLAWPIMLSMATTTVMDVTDTLMVGFLGTKELAAVGVATTLFLLCKSLFVGSFESVKILVSQSIGAKNQEKALAFGTNSLFLLVPSCLLVMSLSLFSDQIFSTMGLEEQVKDFAISYFNIRSLASISWFSIIILSNFFQGLGDTKTPMYINIFVCLLNVLLDPIFIFGFGPIKAYGVAGSAIATELSLFISSILFFYIYKKRFGFSLNLEIKKIKKLFFLGWPSGVRWFVDMLGFTIFTALIARLGTNELAANQIAVKILCLSILPAWGISEAALILIGHHIGAKRLDLVKDSFFSAIKLCFYAMGSLAFLFMAFKLPLVKLFNPSEPVMELAKDLMLAIAIYQFFEAMQSICAMSLNGIGDTKWPMFLSLGSTWGIMIPLAYFFGIKNNYGLTFIWFSACVSLVFLTFSLGYKFITSLPKEKNTYGHIPINQSM